MPKRLLHLVNEARRDARVAMHVTRPADPPRLGLPGRELRFRRYIAATDAGLDEVLSARLGSNYARELVDGDPEVDLEAVGRFIERTETVYLSGAGEVIHASPRVMEVIFGPDGSERERRDPQDEPANVNDDLPVRWTPRRMPRAAVVRRFAMRRTVQLRHVDGLTYDYLFAMARELAEEDAMVLVGGGKSGRDPLVFQENGTPYRGFLEGRVEGERYMLLLHLSNLELRRPAPGGEATEGSGGDA